MNTPMCMMRPSEMLWPVRGQPPLSATQSLTSVSASIEQERISVHEECFNKFNQEEYDVELPGSGESSMPPLKRSAFRQSTHASHVNDRTADAV